MPALSRRQFIGFSLTSMASVKASLATVPAKTLSLRSTHTGESLTAEFEKNGYLVPDNLTSFDYVLRDHRDNEMIAMDSGLLYQLHALQMRLGSFETIEVISGYRTLKSNNLLRSNSTRVAKKSYHLLGRAIDIRIPKTDTKTLRDAALELAAGGVGYYPESGFIHLDTGPVRAW